MKETKTEIIALLIYGVCCIAAMVIMVYFHFKFNKRDES